MSEDQIRQEPTDELDDEVEEAWFRDTNDQEVRGVAAIKPYGDDWRVGVFVAEFLRDEPLESQLRQKVHAALMSLDGVIEVIHEDREQWIAVGSPKGNELVSAVAQVVDSLADRARLYIDSL
jgi:hypothetical protein